MSDMKESAKTKNGSAPERPTCGIVMPISSFADYSGAHWSEVREIIGRAVEGAAMDPRPVWQSSDTDIIQGRIVRNLYECPMVVCDISGLNPNVMFELGMRLTFRKPVVVVCDTLTRLPFDTGVIDTLIYSAELHFPSIEKFIIDLSSRLSDLQDAFASGVYKPYLDTFGAFQVVDPPKDHVSFSTHLGEQLERIETKLTRLERVSASIPAKSSGIFGMQPQRTPDDFSRSKDASVNAILDQYAGIAEMRAPSQGGSSYWTQARLDLLRAMWLEGKTASEIARELGGRVSTNAVIGRAHRLGLTSRPIGDGD